MEGISHEACSLAGTLGLGKLIAFYDDNNISIDGEVEGWFTDDTPKRFEAYGWHVIPDVDGHDADAIKKAIEEARAATDKPSIICCKTTIGFGSPNKGGKEDCHGAPLGEDEIELTRKELGWSHGPFQIPEDIYEGWDAKDKGAKAEAAWDTKMAAYKKDHPELARGFERRMAGELVDGWEEKANAFIQAVAAKAESIPSRKASQNSIEALSGFTDFMGGSADLAGSNLTIVSNSVPMRADTPNANYINYGVREFAMGAIVNGIALHGGFVPYGATFLMFSEYQRNSLRMAALMQIQHIEVFTHDSIGLGEDGPTHQPVEQIATLRMIPRMSVWRPCDAVESAVAWKLAVKRTNAPTSLIFSRQNLDHQNRSAKQIESIEKGGYILKDPDGEPDAIIIATGSEVGLAIKAAAELEASGKKIRVVSMPSADTFDAQDEVYKASVLPGNRTPRIAVEAGVSDYWRKYVGLNGEVVGIDTFGESAPAGQLFEHFGFTVENVVKTVEGLL